MRFEFDLPKFSFASCSEPIQPIGIDFALVLSRTSQTTSWGRWMTYRFRAIPESGWAFRSFDRMKLLASGTTSATFCVIKTLESTRLRMHLKRLFTLDIVTRAIIQFTAVHYINGQFSYFLARPKKRSSPAFLFDSALFKLQMSFERVEIEEELTVDSSRGPKTSSSS